MAGEHDVRCTSRSLPDSKEGESGFSFSGGGTGFSPGRIPSESQASARGPRLDIYVVRVADKSDKQVRLDAVEELEMGALLTDAHDAARQPKKRRR